MKINKTYKSLLEKSISSMLSAIELYKRPSVFQARVIGDRIIARMKEFVEVFVKGMIA